MRRGRPAGLAGGRKDGRDRRGHRRPAGRDALGGPGSGVHAEGRTRLQRLSGAGDLDSDRFQPGFVRVHPGGRRPGRAAFLSRRDGAWNASLCALTDPAELVAATVSPIRAPAARRRVALLSGGSFASARLMALDRRGRVLAYGFGRGDVERISVCPGSRYAVELVRQGARSRAAVRDLRSMRVVRSLALPAAAVELSCGDLRGRAIHAAALGYSRAYPPRTVEGAAAAPGRTVAVATLGGDAIAFGRTTASWAASERVGGRPRTGGVRALTRLKNADELTLARTARASRSTAPDRSAVRLVDLGRAARLLARVRGGRPVVSWAVPPAGAGSAAGRVSRRNLTPPAPPRRRSGPWARHVRADGCSE